MERAKYERNWRRTELFYTGSEKINGVGIILDEG